MVYVKIENWGEMELEYLLKTIRLLRKAQPWDFKKWQPTDSVIDKVKGTETKYTGQTFDSQLFDLVKNGWTHDHCEICTVTLSDRQDFKDWKVEGYKNNGDWICEQCYSLFMVPIDIEQHVKTFQLIEKSAQ